jgi:hypothetical protein
MFQIASATSKSEEEKKKGNNKKQKQKPAVGKPYSHIVTLNCVGMKALELVSGQMLGPSSWFQCLPFKRITNG